MERETDHVRRLKVFLYEMKYSPLMFDASEILQLVPLLSPQYFVYAVYMARAKILPITLEELSQFLTISEISTEHQLALVHAFSESIINSENKNELEKILQVIPILGVRNTAKELIEKNICSQIFGPITENRVTIYVDNNHSMGDGIPDQQFTHMDYILYDLQRSLAKAKFQYSIIGLAKNALIDSAMHPWDVIVKKLENPREISAGEKTNLNYIKLNDIICNNKNSNAVYLLLSNYPEEGERDVNKLIKQALDLVPKQSSPTPIHTFVFRPFAASEDKNVQIFAYKLSAATGGRYRCVDPNDPVSFGKFNPSDNAFIDTDTFEFYYENQVAGLPDFIVDLASKPSLYKEVAENTPNFKALLAKRPRLRGDINISSVGIKEDEKRHWYEVEISMEIISNSSYTWTIKEGYTEFKDLHAKVKDSLEERKKKSGHKISFPPDPLFQSKLVDQLQTYLKEIYVTESSNTDANNFFHWDAEMEKANTQLTQDWQTKYLEFLKGKGPKPILSEKLGDLIFYINFRLL
eukprot:Phypoly_transcript_06051.p1 GENE.Phypoly_transcript_06051~~Phypoly_transcript_06051.p1  ORF type:complete len:610 (+),score=83.07 Phypoly_transcript_06051:267-1832(+)